jgi:hypothetical protein
MTGIEMALLACHSMRFAIRRCDRSVSANRMAIPLCTKTRRS